MLNFAAETASRGAPMVISEPLLEKSICYVLHLTTSRSGSTMHACHARDRREDPLDCLEEPVKGEKLTVCGTLW